MSEGHDPTPGRDPPSPAPSPGAHGVPFPVTLSVVVLAAGFASTRMFGGLSLKFPWLNAVGAFCAVAGVVLALVACGVLAFRSDLPSPLPVKVLRALGLAPVALMVLAAMWSVPPHAVQWAALAGACVWLLVAGLRGAALAGPRWSARVALVLLAVGEVLELVAPPAHVVAVPGTFWPELATRLGPVTELLAFVGITAAAVWAVRSTREAAGPARALAFSLTPLSLALVLLVVPTRLPRTTEHLARVAFSVRFDLISRGAAGHPARAELALYTLLFSGLLLAASVSFGAQQYDRGGGTRRALGWLCVLLSGFGAAGLAGLVDPLRVAALLLGVALLEQAAELDRPA